LMMSATATCILLAFIFAANNNGTFPQLLKTKQWHVSVILEGGGGGDPPIKMPGREYLFCPLKPPAQLRQDKQEAQLLL